MKKEIIEVTTEVSQKELEDALNSSDIPSKKRWSIISSLEGNRELKEEINKIKGGIKEKFDIRLVTRGFIEEQPQFDLVKIGRKIQISPISLYWDEIEERDKLMKDILRGLIDESIDNQSEEENEYDR